MRYRYNAQGDLIGVYNRAGEQTRICLGPASADQPASSGARTTYQWNELSPQGGSSASRTSPA